MQPPGKRRIPGCKSASACARSVRRPFSSPLNVSTGNREMCSTSTAAAGFSSAQSIRKAAFCRVLGAVRSTSYFAHLEPFTVTSSAVRIWLSSQVEGSQRKTSTPVVGVFPDVRAQKETRYCAPASRPMPNHPLFSRPHLATGCPGYFSRTKCGFFSKGPPSSRTFTLPKVFQPCKGLSYSKERLTIFSAYRPPSAAKLMSSRKIPYIVGWMGMPGAVSSTTM